MLAPASILPLSVRDLGYAARGRWLLQGLSFDLLQGMRTVIMGPNGAGKSLTLRLCHGLLRPTCGSVRWRGAGADHAALRHVMVSQRPVLLRRSARANLIHALAVAGQGFRARRERAWLALEHFGLTHLAERPARVLSGGEQQRLAMARAWALQPEVLFLDEPTAALDPAATRAIEDMIHTFHAEGVKVVMTTHDLGQARRLADEILFLHQGRLVEWTPAEAFFEAPRSVEGRAFICGELLW